MFWTGGVTGFDDAEKINLFDLRLAVKPRPPLILGGFFLLYLLYLKLKKFVIRGLKK